MWLDPGADRFGACRVSLVDRILLQRTASRGRDVGYRERDFPGRSLARKIEPELRAQRIESRSVCTR